MTKGEKEALEILNNTEWNGFMITIKNLIEKQESEINKLNNLIDKMAEIIEDCRANGCLETTDDLDMSEIAGANKIKEYFMKEDK